MGALSLAAGTCSAACRGGGGPGGGAHLGGDLRGVYIEVPTNEVQRASKLERSSPGVAS
eukprot:SAG31_NODE_1841_length_7117_cov_12.976207_4_plen_59_part_00